MIKLVESNDARDLLDEMRDVHTEEYRIHHRWNNRFAMTGFELGRVMLALAAEDLPVIEGEVTTPVDNAKCPTRRVDQAALAIVSVLRAGELVATACRKRYPNAKRYWIKIYRDEVTGIAVVEGHNLPSSFAGLTVIVVDPMLATGGTMVAALNMVKLRQPAHVAAICFVGCPVGRSLVESTHPDVNVWLAALDPVLTAIFYIWWGLGDAGDRAFGKECEEGLRVLMEPYGPESVQAMVAFFRAKQERLAKKAKAEPVTAGAYDKYFEGTDKI